MRYVQTVKLFDSKANKESRLIIGIDSRIAFDKSQNYENIWQSFFLNVLNLQKIKKKKSKPYNSFLTNFMITKTKSSTNFNCFIYSFDAYFISPNSDVE